MSHHQIDYPDAAAMQSASNARAVVSTSNIDMVLTHNNSNHHLGFGHHTGVAGGSFGAGSSNSNMGLERPIRRMHSDSVVGDQHQQQHKQVDECVWGGGGGERIVLVLDWGGRERRREAQVGNMVVRKRGSDGREQFRPCHCFS